MRKVMILFLGLLLFTASAAFAVGEPNYAHGVVAQGDVSNTEFFYTANVKSQDGNFRAEDDFDIASPGTPNDPYTWRLQEWVPSSIGCGCFETIYTTQGHVADGSRHHECYSYGVESGKVYRVKYSHFNNFSPFFNGDWWAWGYEHNCP